MLETDIPRLMEIEKECFSTPWTASMFMCQIRLVDISANLVFIEGGVIAGYVIAWFGYEEMHLLSIGVMPASRGLGLAEKLLDEAMKRSKKAGGIKVILEVRASNSRARRFYQKMGFRRVGVRKGYYSESGEDALVLERYIEEPD